MVLRAQERLVECCPGAYLKDGFQTILHYIGYLRGIGSMLQGSSLDILEGHQMVSLISLLQGMMMMNLIMLWKYARNG